MKEKVSPSVRLNKIMNDRNLKQVDILEMSKPFQKELRITMGKSALSQYVNGKQAPDQHRVYLLAKTLGVNEAWLMGYDVPMKKDVTPSNLIPIKQTKLIPVIGSIACGSPIFAEQNIIDTVAFPVELLPSGEVFFLQANGDSMEPDIKDGSYVMIRKQEDVENGEIAAVLLNGDEDSTLKRVRKMGNTILLEAINDAYEPYLVNEENPARIIGKAVKVLNDL